MDSRVDLQCQVLCINVCSTFLHLSCSLPLLIVSLMLSVVNRKSYRAYTPSSLENLSVMLVMAVSTIGRKNSLLKASSGVDCVSSALSYRNCFFFLRCLLSGNFLSMSRSSAISTASVWLDATPFPLKSSRYSVTPQFLF